MHTPLETGVARSAYLPGRASSGARASCPKLRESIALSEQFAGLPDGMSRYDVLNLVKDVGRSFGFASGTIRLLEYYLRFTRDIDWQEGNRPIVYQQVNKTALDLGVSDRQVRYWEGALMEIGALSWSDSGNFRRYGWRDAETGEIDVAFGVDLSPLAFLIPELQAKKLELEQYKKDWMATKTLVSRYRALIRSRLEEMLNRDVLAQRSLELCLQYDDIKHPIRPHMDLESLEDLAGAHQDLLDTITSELEAVECKEETSKKCELSQNTSAIAEENFRYKYNTKQIQSDESDTNKANANLSLREEDNGLGHSHTGTVHTNGKDGGDVRAQETKARLEPEPKSSTGAEHVKPIIAIQAASDGLRGKIALRPGQPLSWHDLVDAAEKRCRDLNIHRSAWVDACTTMDRYSAALAVLITDLKAESHAAGDLKWKTFNAGGYLRALTKRAEQGKLHLHKSIFGVLNRERADNEN